MSRERAIVVTPRAPWPQDDGGRIGLWQTVWAAAQEWDVTLLALVPPAELDDPVPPEVTALGVDVVRIAHRPPPTWRAAVQGAWGRWPYTITRFQNPQLDARLRDLVARERPRFVLLNHLALGTYAASARPAAVVLREHNVESLWMERFASGPLPPWTRAYARHQAVRIAHAERELCEAADLVLAIHDEERELLARLAPRARVETVPVGIDPARFLPRAVADPPIVLVVGAFGWPPNADGLRRFLVEGWPALRTAAPHVRLRVAGKDLAPALRKEIDAAGGEAVGYVEDIAVEFAMARVLLVPLWVGAGSRVKIIEGAMAGVPVVSTSQGAEGLGFVDGHELLIDDLPAGLARGVLRLVADPAEAERIAAAARVLALERFALSAVAARANALCRSAVPRATEQTAAAP
jgi:glycosyltransferase involved in cell wall biosynthesis